MTKESVAAVGVRVGFVVGAVLAACQAEAPESHGGLCQVTLDCNGGELCENHVCVAIGGSEEGESSGDDGPADSGPADSGPADSGPADSGPADSGPADSGPADSGPADSGPADTGPAETCVEGDFTCEVDHIVACVDGQLEQYTCNEVCGADGYTSSGCDGDQCNCDGFADIDCANGVAAFCVCLESAGESCSNDDFIDFYQQCRSGTAPEFECFADYISNDTVDCSAAVTACL